MLGSTIHRADAFRPTRERWLFAWSLLAGMLLFAAVAGPYWLGRVYTADDLWAYHLPVRQFYAECLAAGERFDWMPSLYSGFYLTGEGQAGTYHPLHWLLYRCLPLRAAFDLELLLNYPFLLAGTFLFLRCHLRSSAAMFGSLVFTFCGFNLLHFVHPNAIAVVTHLPWLLLAIHASVERPTSNAQHRTEQVPRSRSSTLDVGRSMLDVRAIIAETAISLLTASQLLLGYPQYVWFSLLAEAAYAAVLLSPTWRKGWAPNVERPTSNIEHRTKQVPLKLTSMLDVRRWTFDVRYCLRLAGLKLLGLLIGAVQLLPTFDALRESQRQAADGQFAQQGALDSLNLLQLISPYLFRDRVVGGNTHEFGLYVGAVPVALIAWLLLRRTPLGTCAAYRKLAAIALAGAGLSIWLALGRAGLLYTLQTHLPLAGKFRFPSRYLVLVHLALAVAAAAAFAELARVAARRRRERTPVGEQAQPSPRPAQRAGWAITRSQWTGEFAPLWRLTILACGLAFAAGWIWNADVVQSLPLRLVGPALLVGATVLIDQAVRGARWAWPALILLTAADLGVYGCTYAIWPSTYTLETALSTIPEPDAAKVATELHDPSQHDALQPALRVGNQMVLRGWRQLDGYAGLEPARKLDYRNVNALRVAGVERVLRSPATEAIAGLLPLDDRWLGVPSPLPQARIVEQCVESHDAGREIQRINVDLTAVVERRPPPFAGTLSLGQPSIKRVVTKPGRIIVLGECCEPQLLVLTERFHSGWQATVNGTPVEVVRTNGEFLGCVTAPGGSCQTAPGGESMGEGRPHQESPLTLALSPKGRGGCVAASSPFVAEFKFLPVSLRYGKWLSAAGLILLSLYTAVRLTAQFVGGAR